MQFPRRRFCNARVKTHFTAEPLRPLQQSFTGARRFFHRPSAILLTGRRVFFPNQGISRIA